MSKNYLEALKRMEYFVNEEMGIKTFKQSGWHIEGTDDYELVKEGLQRLEAIDNSSSSEALEELEKFTDFYDTRYNRVCINAHNTIKQALIKAQEQEKALNIIKKKKVDTRILRNCLKDETPEHYNFLNDKHQLTQEEFDLLKEMLI